MSKRSRPELEAIREIIAQAAGTEPPSATQLLARLSELPSPYGDTLASEYQGLVGVLDGYTLEQHTRMVLRQFERYFPRRDPGMRHERFRIVLALHDIGKPAAVRRGSKHWQHEETLRVLDLIQGYLPFTESELTLASAVIDGDPLGLLFRGHHDLASAADELASMARRAGRSVADFLPTLLTFYQCDAASYTADAGGSPALDRLFVPTRSGSGFAHTASGERLLFCPALEAQLQELCEALGGTDRSAQD